MIVFFINVYASFLVADTFVVTTAAGNTSTGSLSWAITQSQNSRNNLPHSIEFNIPGSTQHTIALEQSLPNIVIGTNIKGYSQPGSVQKKNEKEPAVIKIIIDGGKKFQSGLFFNQSKGSSVSGIIFKGFNASQNSCAIKIDKCDSVAVKGNYIGTDGINATPNYNGIHVTSSSNILIGGPEIAAQNVISGNAEAGIFLNVCKTCQVEGNLIGTDMYNTKAIPNNSGIVCWSNDSVKIGGTKNTIAGNKLAGIALAYGTINTAIQGNFIGTNGVSSFPNYCGISIDGAKDTSVLTKNTLIGGTEVALRNIISGNATAGIYINKSSLVQIEGNYIGTDVNGNKAQPNNHGILVDYGDSLKIGTTKNIVAGNKESGITLNNTTNSFIKGCFIGTDGTNSLGSKYGVALNGCSNIIIGGPDLASQNVICGNTQAGVSLIKSQLNQVEGNLIGVSAAYNKIPNFRGIYIESCDFTTIGRGKNVIAGNQDSGIVVNNTTNTTIKGNYIGTDGTNALANYNGIYTAYSAGIIIGGPDVASRNVISGNVAAGISLNQSSIGQIEGNFIGVDYNGGKPLANRDGVAFDSSHTFTVGGARNVISSCLDSGITLFNTSNVCIKGNHIGTDYAGKNKLGNTVGIFQTEGLGATGGYNIYGGTDAASRNLISGNLQYGIYMANAALIGSRIQQNYIGPDVTGNAPLPLLSSSDYSQLMGICFESCVAQNLINTKNVISGNAERGVSVHSSGNVSIAGNFIGTNADGSAALSSSANLNNQYGLYLYSCNNGSNLIGGVTAAMRNIISGNLDHGVSIRNCTQSLVRGNYIGTNAAGTAKLPNKIGVRIQDCIASNLIGGLDAASRNVISGNSDSGISLSKARNCLIKGNYLGLNAAGSAAIANNIGIRLLQSTYATMGGTAAGRNVVSGNTTYGIYFDQAYENSLTFNYIGLDASGTKVIYNGNNTGSNIGYATNKDKTNNEIENNKYGV